ncbi:MAG: hypothetical protein U0821_25805 [Chloroflexota bacterium]
MKLKSAVIAIVAFVAGVAVTTWTVVPAATVSAQQDAYAAAQKAQVIATVYHLDKVGFHGLEDAINAGNIPAGSLGTVRRARVTMMAVDWPAAMRETVTSLNTQMLALEAALKDENAEAAKVPAHEVHEIEHDLSGAVYTWLGGGQAAPAAPAMGTPAAKPAGGHGH